jgi:deoxyribodipyrimidine photolyase-related protein
MRNLILVLGDQLDPESAAFDDFEPGRDVVWMAEVAGESTKVWSSKPRTAFFLSAMRHHREALIARGLTVIYRELTPEGGQWMEQDGALRSSAAETFGDALAECVPRLKPERLILVEPGEWGVRNEISIASESYGIPLEIREDRQFLCSHAQFSAHAEGRKQLRMEFFYREMRQRHGVLMEKGKPVGGVWNFDSENRKSFGKEGPPRHPVPRRFEPDEITRGVINLVNTRFQGHPGSLDAFDWPVTSDNAHATLEDFITHRLAAFGDWQDAMWTDEPWLFHSRLSAVLNVKLIHPKLVIAAAENAWKTGAAPLEATEGFIRQILGWREYVRGIYWRNMPQYLYLNALNATSPLPSFYWTGDTEMVCLKSALSQTLKFGYAHHIQRLMVTGLYTLLLGANPREVHAWYLAVYVDAVEWVELPNSLGMSQYADGGLMASKPYVATGKYIQRMSNYCSGCVYNPAERTGEKACPFTTLYWDFLLRHEQAMRFNQRMSMQVRNLERISCAEREAIRARAKELRH